MASVRHRYPVKDIAYTPALFNSDVENACELTGNESFYSEPYKSMRWHAEESVLTAYNTNRDIIARSLTTGSNIESNISSHYSRALTLSGRYVTLALNYALVEKEGLQLSNAVSDWLVTLSVPQKIEKIRAQLGMSITDISKVMGVTRPTIYGWIKLAEPHKDALLKLDYIYNEAEKLNEIKLHRPDLMLKRPIFNGKSIVDFLVSGEALSKSQLQHISEIDRYEHQERCRNDSTMTRIRDYDDVLGGFDVATLKDEADK